MESIRVLMVEDSPFAADVNARQIRKSGVKVEYRVISTEPEMIRALQAEDWDLILSDNYMPRFSALGALRVRNSMKCTIPFIVVSEQMNQDDIKLAYENGLSAFVHKSSLEELNEWILNFNNHSTINT